MKAKTTEIKTKTKNNKIDTADKDKVKNSKWTKIKFNEKEFSDCEFEMRYGLKNWLRHIQ